MGFLERDPDPYLERRRPVLDLPDFSKRQVGWRRTWFPFLIYRGHRSLKELLWLVAMAKIYSNRKLIRIHRCVTDRFLLSGDGDSGEGAVDESSLSGSGETDTVDNAAKTVDG
jgi:hypothetical protein